MSNEKFEKWVSWLERLVTLIKPKFHNAITKTVVIFGLTLTVESQVNILEAFAVASFESLFGPSEYLRNLFATSTNSWIGVAFVIFGLLYNAVVTVGLELIQKYKAAIPEKPDLIFNLKNGDGVTIESSYKLRGAICHHDIESIPDNTSYSEHYQNKIRNEFIDVGVTSKVLMRPSRFDDPEINKSFYKDRAKFLRVWGGAEILYLCIENLGEALGRNVRVELTVDKQVGLSLSNENNLAPKFPKQETESFIYNLHVPKSIPSYDIKSSDSNVCYFFEWKAGDIQAKHSKSSKTDIFVRCEQEFDINFKIYCDELSEPIEKVYKIHPTPEKFNFDLAFLKKNEKEFFESVDQKIMDGYIGRQYEKILKDHAHKEEELLP
ncbi:hypothetical protein K0J45_16830 [Shewanella alkalitolerans]|uniref:hypothetical protein n=1 Tax=Shewanella alkalitolerans TaxID=2864209 RepID=UPI001C6580E2|nr:hypothetical protein [Shewanella alkalitolerans]QYJ97154.1 hypothetical protein K0J45_16830 [Shewanella alkalitolerans]